MAEYGLTSTGPVIKRLDEITEEIHETLSTELGVNTRLNPESLMNHMITNIADQIAELWEFGEEVYFSQYPSTAEGSNLDSAAQYGGTTRGTPVPSYYAILCTGVDGTVIPSGTILATNTNPTTYLELSTQNTIERSQFNKAVIKGTTTDASSTLTVAINEVPYSYIPLDEETITEAFRGLYESIQTEAFDISFDEDNLLISLESVDASSNSSLILSENLTTETVSTIITFATQEDGDIMLPNGQVTKIVKAVSGLTSVVNVGSYISGQLAETDTELRKSYVDKIYSRSSRMLESIKSAVLDNVQGIKSLAPFENDSNEVDEMGRWPHSVEIVVDGGDPTEIAQQILASKAGGISTFGDVAVVVPGEYGEDITIRFNRPTYLYIWIQVSITMSSTTPLSSNYVDLIKEAILENMEDVEAGTTIIPQKIFTTQIYDTVSGVDFADFMIATSYDETRPEDYTMRTVSVSARERAVTSLEKIEVVIDG